MSATLCDIHYYDPLNLKSVTSSGNFIKPMKSTFSMATQSCVPILDGYCFYKLRQIPKQLEFDKDSIQIEQIT